MRFVSPETARIQLSDGFWIEVKKELTVGEDKRFRTAGMRRMSPATSAQRGEIDVDWTAMAFARVEAYLVDWNAKDASGKDVKITRSSIEALSKDSFEEIDAAILAHIAETDDEKKETTTPSSATSTSAS